MFKIACSLFIIPVTFLQLNVSWFFRVGNGIPAENVKDQSNVMEHFLYSQNPRQEGWGLLTAQKRRA